jgi:hypothetical protein
MKHPQIVNLAPALLKQAEGIHLAENRFFEYLEASKDLENQYIELRHNFISNPSAETQSAFEVFCASRTARTGLLEDIRIGRFNAAKIYQSQLSEIMRDPLRREISRLQELHAASVLEDETLAADLGSEDFASGKTRLFADYIELSTSVWNDLRNSCISPSRAFLSFITDSI